ncbi:hypothetical protein CR513_33264, partial [Mucuna pruriens]
MGDDYMNLHSKFHDFDDFKACDCTCTELTEYPIHVESSNVINASAGVIDVAEVVEVIALQPLLPSIAQPLQPLMITANKIEIEQKEISITWEISICTFLTLFSGILAYLITSLKVKNHDQPNLIVYGKNESKKEKEKATQRLKEKKNATKDVRKCKSSSVGKFDRAFLRFLFISPLRLLLLSPFFIWFLVLPPYSSISLRLLTFPILPYTSLALLCHEGEPKFYESSSTVQVGKSDKRFEIHYKSHGELDENKIF